MSSPIANKASDSAFIFNASETDLLQEHVKELYFQQILPALQEVLYEQGKQDTLPPEAFSLNIDKLTQAGTRHELKELLRKELLLQTSGQQPCSGQSTQPNEDNIKALSLLNDYLQKGIIPAPFTPAKTFNYLQTLEECYQLTPAETLQSLKGGLSRQAARQRFLHLCSVKECFDWIGRLATHQQLTESRLLEEWLRLLQQNIFHASVIRLLRERLLQDTVGAKPASSAIILLANQFLLLRNTEGKKAGLLVNHLVKLDPDISLQNRTLLISSANPHAPVPASLVASQKKWAVDSQIQPEDNRLPVTNAGLVLLYTFLKPYLLKATNLSEQELEHPENRVRAAQLLHFLCTGHSGTPEHQMVFNKILCGVPLYQPIPARLIITSKIRKNAHEVLQTVITHWSILKCSSIAQLRELYLQRSGVLEKTKTGWTLHFEKKSAAWLPEQVLLGVQQFTTPFGNQQITVGW